MKRPLLLLLLCSLLSLTGSAQDSLLVNDVTRLNPIRVAAVISPRSTAEIMDAVRTHAGPVSIGGGRYSMGGQTATEGALQIDMRRFDSVLAFSAEKQEVTVQTGISWHRLQEYIDPYNLSVRIMQTYANFTVGGSLSVNCHGRYVGLGPIILSVKSIRMVLADGSLVSARPDSNAALFYGAIGGYGGLGVIVEATLRLTGNCVVERSDRLMPIAAYRRYFFSSVRPDSTAVFHNADIYPDDYSTVRAITYRKSSSPPTNRARLRPQRAAYKGRRFLTRVVAGGSFGKTLREDLLDPLFYSIPERVWRNYEASYDVAELEPASRTKYTYVLQEYFVPADSFDAFYPRLRSILQGHRVNALNISIRHARADPGSLLAWARSEVFAFVLYYRQGTDEQARSEVGRWTVELIDAALRCGGSYYLPYQIWASPEQFARAYPNAAAFFALKKKVDPVNKFRNKLWDAYFQPAH